MRDSREKARVFSSPAHFFAFGFGGGLSPWAPGTIGTLFAIPLYLVVSQLSLPFYVLFLLASFAFGIYICEKTSHELGVHDHGGIVWDEFVGYWLTMLLAPPGIVWIVIGFVLFRLFDILKPFPVGYLDSKVKGGLGIMLDDVVAAVFAWFCLQALAMLILK